MREKKILEEQFEKRAGAFFCGRLQSLSRWWAGLRRPALVRSFGIVGRDDVWRPLA
jgi:hypothetical protein